MHDDTPDPCPTYDSCSISGGGGGSGGGSGGGTGGGCLYCYTRVDVPYGNCFSAADSLNYPMYSNCNGTRFCWRDSFGNQYCEPGCTGNACYRA